MKSTLTFAQYPAVYLAAAGTPVAGAKEPESSEEWTAAPSWMQGGCTYVMGRFGNHLEFPLDEAGLEELAGKERFRLNPSGKSGEISFHELNYIAVRVEGYTPEGGKLYVPLCSGCAEVEISLNRLGQVERKASLGVLCATERVEVLIPTPAS